MRPEKAKSELTTGLGVIYGIPTYVVEASRSHGVRPHRVSSHLVSRVRSAVHARPKRQQQSPKMITSARQSWR